MSVENEWQRISYIVGRAISDYKKRPTSVENQYVDLLTNLQGVLLTQDINSVADLIIPDSDNLDPAQQNLREVAAFLYGLDDTGTYDRIRSLQHSLATTTLGQLKLNAGDSYLISREVNALTNGSNADIWIATGATPLWAVFGVVASGQCSGFLYEGAAQSAAGTSFTPVNENRTSGNTSDASVEFDPTISGTGTRLSYSLIVGGGGPFAAGGTLNLQNANSAFLLDANTNYLFRLTNTSGGDIDAGMTAEFYED